MDDISSDCDPIIRNSDIASVLYRATDKDKKGPPLDPSGVAWPCGLVAKSFFNDTFALYNTSGRVAINENGIAWESDKEYKFKNGDLN